MSKKEAAMKVSGYVAARYSRGVNLESHVANAKVPVGYKFASGYFRILVPDGKAPELDKANYIHVQFGQVIGDERVIEEKEEEKPAKKEAKEPAKKNGKKPPLKVKNPKGEIVEVA